MKRLHQLGPVGPAAYWAAMRALTARDGGFTTRRLAERFADRSVQTIERYVHACAQDGHLDAVGTEPRASGGGTPLKRFAVKVTAPVSAPFERPNADRQFGAAHQQMWTAMRALPTFTSRELAAHASTDDVAITQDTARIFCWKLEKAGYLQFLGRNGRWRTFRLRPGKNTGPTPPAITGSGEVIDRNPRARRRSAS